MLCSFLLLGWDRHDRHELKRTTIGVNTSIRHLYFLCSLMISRFAFDDEQRSWGVPAKAEHVEQESVRSVNIDSILKNATSFVKEEAPLRALVQRGLLKQPQSV